MENIDFNALGQNALRQIRALTHGNGAEKSAVQIKESGNDFIQCDAITHLELHPAVTEEQKKGRAQIGQVLKSAEDVQQAVNKYATDSIKNSEVRKFMATQLLDRPDKGFSIHGDYFDMPSLTQSYAVHEDCKTCHGHGKHGCDACHGNREEVCHVCHGKGMATCQHCYGTGLITDAQGNKKQCHHCGGTRHVTCVLCQRRGRVKCRQCKGTGDMKCNNCKGLGAFTHVSHVALKMKTLFEIDRAALPHPAVKAIERQGTRMVERQHIRVSGEQVKREDGGLAIQYNVAFPYAILLMTINGKPMKIELFGYKGKIMKAPAFIETLIGTQTALLEQAARGEGAIDSQIIKASKTRILAEGLAFVLKAPRKKALIRLKKKYPIGITNDGLKNIVNSARKALDQLTRKARYTGYAIAGVGNVALLGVYFMGGLRDLVTSIMPSNLMLIPDWALIPLGGYLGTLITQKIIRRPLQKALGHILKNPKNTKSGILTNYIVSAGLFIAVLVTMYFLKMPLPSWLPL